jgi:hypothetical protein
VERLKYKHRNGKMWVDTLERFFGMRGENCSTGKYQLNENHTRLE